MILLLTVCVNTLLSISFLTVTVNHKYLQKNMFMILLIEQTGTEESMETAVSVIIPVYNCEKTVGRCINSVLNQTLANIEVIAVNDGSDDSTLKVLKGIIITLSEKTGFTEVRLIFRLRFGTLGNVCIK